MGESDLVEEIKKQLILIKDDNERIGFLEKYINSQNTLPLEVLAFIYESLGEVYKKVGKPKGKFYEKAASNWELSAALNKNEKEISQYKKEALKNALRDYYFAHRIYKQEGYYTGLEEVSVKIAGVRQELKNYSSPFKTFSIIVVMGIFILSFFFLASKPTGFVVAPLETEGTMFVGGILVLLGVVGMFFILHKWH